MRVTVPPRIQLVVEIAPDTPEVLADATQIHQLLVNLFTNACQAMEGRSGKIVVRLSENTLSAAATRGMPGIQPGRFAHLSVLDSGIGIDPAIRDRIFDPFFSTKRVSEGTGLGLAVVNGIVQAHEGFIDVESQPGEGATFHIYLPAAQETRRRGDAAEASVRARGRSRRVLFLDDNEELVSASVQMLSRQGYRASGHTAPEAALDAVRAEPQTYDAVVSDYKIQSMSGLEVARELSRIRPDLPVILISGYIDDELQRMAREAGVRRLLHKLHALDDLVDVIDQVIGDSSPVSRPQQQRSVNTPSTMTSYR
jgi:CheY-like chemotaxis protein